MSKRRNLLGMMRGRLADAWQVSLHGKIDLESESAYVGRYETTLVGKHPANPGGICTVLPFVRRLLAGFLHLKINVQ